MGVERPGGEPGRRRGEEEGEGRGLASDLPDLPPTSLDLPDVAVGPSGASRPSRPRSGRSVGQFEWAGRGQIWPVGEGLKNRICGGKLT